MAHVARVGLMKSVKSRRKRLIHLQVGRSHQQISVLDRPSTCSINGGAMSGRSIESTFYVLLVPGLGSKATGLASKYRYVCFLKRNPDV